MKGRRRAPARRAALEPAADEAAAARRYWVTGRLLGAGRMRRSPRVGRERGWYHERARPSRRAARLRLPKGGTADATDDGT